jgi:oligopeptide/dipeptide ABC transporter ATP-binding protein
VSPPLFEVSGLSIDVYAPRAGSPGGGSESVYGKSDTGWRPALRNTTFSVASGEVLAFVGESGGGKTLSVLGSLDLLAPSARIIAGEVRYKGQLIYPHPVKPSRNPLRRLVKKKNPDYDDVAWRTIVGPNIGVLFQNPVAALSPMLLLGNQTGEVLEEHTTLTQQEVEARVHEIFGRVRLPRWGEGLFRHQLSRGGAQRAMLAGALIKAPELLVADEPLSGLDVSVAASILELIRDLKRERGMAMILVTHDLATVASIADRVAVVYGGRIVEEGPAEQVYYRPTHPYTEGLLGSIPSMRADRLRPISGEPPSITALPKGCAFHPRCPYAIDRCRTEPPIDQPIGMGRVACHLGFELDLRGVGD